jgi:hypothetical protein
MILSKGGPDGYELGTFSSGQLEFRINRESDGATYSLLSNQQYPSDGSTWMHVAVTFDGTKSTLYINGVEDNSVIYASPVGIIANTSPVQIGSRGGSNRWSGTLDDIRLYGRALSAAEVSDLFQDNSSTTRTLDASLKGQPQTEEVQIELTETAEDTMFGFKIYPNPVEDRLHIQLNSREEIPVEVMVYDMMGRQYINKSEIPENGEIVLDLAPVRMAAGAYLLILDQGQGRLKQVKFIKK